MISTKVGDGGRTLVNERWVSKSDPLVQTLGDIDEAISTIVLAIAHIKNPAPTLVASIQDLHDVSSFLCRYLLTFDKTSNVMKMEDLIYSKEIFDFTYPTENTSAAFLNVARATVRRAERSLNQVISYIPELDEESIDRARKYMNRLSDYLFALSLEERGL